jgi:hypothetical protein
MFWVTSTWAWHWFVLQHIVLVSWAMVWIQVDEVKGIMTDNIDKMLARGEKLELLSERTDNLVFEVLHCSVLLLLGWWGLGVGG